MTLLPVEVKAELWRYLRSLLPDGLQPRLGGMADEYIGLLAQMMFEADDRSVSMLLDWFPQSALEEALELVGAARKLRRYPNEPLSIWRSRVTGGYEFWRLAGTLAGVKLALAQAGYKAIVTEHYQDPDQQRWAEFSVLIVPLRAVQRGGRWGLGTWGKTSWGFQLDALPISSVPDLIAEVKPAHARLRRLSFSAGVHVWGGGEEWGRSEQYATGHPWGSPHGLPSVVFRESSDSDLKWGAGQIEVIYEMEGLHAEEG